VAGEFLLGGFGALAGGVGAASLIPDQGGWSEPGVIAAGVCLYLLGSNLGCATGVYLIGNSGGETGSYLSALEGTYAGTLVGGMIAFPLLVALGEDNEQWSLVALAAVQSWGATLGFNSSRKKKSEGSLEALLNLNDGELAFSFPQVDVFQESFSSGEYRVNLFQAKF